MQLKSMRSSDAFDHFWVNDPFNGRNYIYIEALWLVFWLAAK